MISDRKKKWDKIVIERQEMKDKAGKLIADLDFWNAIGKPQNEEYFDKTSELTGLQVRYKGHIEKYQSLADQLNKEIDILNQFL